MNWFKNIFNRKPLSKANTPNLPNDRSPTSPSSHERHLHFLSDRGDLNAAASDIFQTMLQQENGKAIEHTPYFHLIDGNKDLMMSALIKETILLSMLPYYDTDCTWPVKIHETITWANGIEGVLKVAVNGTALIGFYDHFFFANKKIYRTDKTENFAISGLVYTLERIKIESSFSADFCGYFPISAAEQGAEDEIRFMTRIHEMKAFEFYGIPFVALKVCLAKVEDVEMITTLFAPQSSVPEGLTAGDMVSGMAWMFGQLMGK